MYNTDLFNEIVAKAQSYLAPVTKTNKLFVANLEKLVAFQFATAQSYADFALARLQAATDVSDADSLKAFAEAQVAAAETLRQKLVDDAKAFADLGAGFKAEFEALVAEFGVEPAPKAVVKTSRKAIAPAA